VPSRRAVSAVPKRPVSGERGAATSDGVCGERGAAASQAAPQRWSNGAQTEQLWRRGVQQKPDAPRVGGYLRRRRAPLSLCSRASSSCDKVNVNVEVGRSGPVTNDEYTTKGSQQLLHAPRLVDHGSRSPMPSIDCRSRTLYSMAIEPSPTNFSQKHTMCSQDERVNTRGDFFQGSRADPLVCCHSGADFCTIRLRTRSPPILV